MSKYPLPLRPVRLALVRRRRPALALACGGGGDPVVLSRIGMHRLALHRFRRDQSAAREYVADHIRSLAACGKTEAALDAGRAARPTKSQALALALAPLAADLALEKYAGTKAGLRGGLAAAAGRGRLALALAASDDGADARFLEASLLRTDPERATAAWRAGFAAYGLAPPQRIDAARPVCVTNATAAAEPVNDGQMISVIMPARNAAEHVSAAVRSVLDQTWRNLELLFVDDASQDDTAALAVAAAGGDPRFRLIRRERRGGAYRARNDALEIAFGKWVAIQDSDEWSHPERFAIQVRDMQRRGLAATSARSLRIDAAGEIHARGIWPLARWAPSTLMFERRAALERAGPFDEVLSGADNEFWWRLTAIFGPDRVCATRVPLILGAWRADSLTGAPDSGFGARGFNLDRLAYWEAWMHWHARHRRTPGDLRIARGARPFAIPDAIRL